METEETNVASAEVNASEPLSFGGALDILNQADEAPVEETTAASETAEAGEPDEEAEQVQQSDENSDETVETTPEADTEDDFVHGNHRTRLRDGSVTTVGELKKLADEAKELKAKLPSLEAREREFEQKQQAIAAQEAQTSQLIQNAKAVLQANFPPKPDYAAVERGDVDIITYQEQVAKYNNAVEKWQGLTRAEQAKAQEVQQRQAAERQHYLAQETERLIERVPEFKDPDARKAFAQEATKIGAEAYGMPAGTMENLGETWAVLAMKDAIAYRKLQAEKPKAMEKAKAAPPVQVQAPGRRVSPAEKQAQDVKTGFNRLRQTRSIDDALAILNSLD